jgi:hypothetical protein
MDRSLDNDRVLLMWLVGLREDNHWAWSHKFKLLSKEINNWWVNNLITEAR